MKKTIGVISRSWIASYKDIPLYGFRRDLLTYLRKYDINVISIPINFDEVSNGVLEGKENKKEILEKEFERIKEILDFCDGIIFPGGNHRTTFDSMIVEYLNKINKPTLGICLGMQIMSKTYNGDKVEKIGNYSHSVLEEYAHDITIDKNSFLYKILGKEKIKVNSRHICYIPDTNLDKVAYSDDGILEAVEDKSKKFFIGVQWHPESLYNDEFSKKLFDYFINEAI